MKFITSIGLALATLTGVDAFSQQGPGFGGRQSRGFGGPQQEFGGPGRGPGGDRRPTHPVSHALDVNNNQILEAEEIKAAKANLLKLDRNKDGQLSSDETDPGPPGGQRGGRGFGGPRGGGPGGNEQPRGGEAGFGGPRGNEGGFGGPRGGGQDNFGGPRGGQGRGNFGGPGGGSPPPHPLQSAIDTNNDGTMDRAELNNAPASLLKQDEDGDGTLSLHEMRPKQGFGGPGGQRGGFGGPRGGQDGNFAGPRGGQDGFGGPVGGQDFRGPQSMPRGASPGVGQRQQSSQSNFGGGRPGGFGAGATGGGGFGAPNAQSPQAGDEAVNRMMSLDKNGDGRLTQEEIPTRLRGLMQADKDKDGMITRGEATAYVNQLRSRRSGGRVGAPSAPGLGQRRPAFDE